MGEDRVPTWPWGGGGLSSLGEEAEFKTKSMNGRYCSGPWTTTQTLPQASSYDPHPACAHSASGLLPEGAGLQDHEASFLGQGAGPPSRLTFRTPDG